MKDINNEMISKKLTIEEINNGQYYLYDYLFEGENEEKIDKDILDFVKSWYDEDFDDIEINIGEGSIDFGFVKIRWWTELYSKEKYIEELLEERIK